MRLHLFFTLASAILLLGPGCASTQSSYRSSSLRINPTPNQYTAELAVLKAPKIEESLNRAFIADGRFTQGSGLILGIEVTSFQAPRSAGSQAFTDQLANSYRFLPGILVVSARWYDDHQKQLEQVEFAEDIMPLPGEVSVYSSINQAIERINQRIMLYTTDHYLASGKSSTPSPQ
jgi:hypothetical protein